MTKVHRRTNYIIKPGFQSRLTAIFILIVIIVANIVGALVYACTILSLEKTFSDAKIPIEEERLAKNLLPGVILAEFVSIVVVALICIIVTHTIAGPVYRMERVAKSIGDGDLTNFIKLRPKDELKDLADTMNEMTIGLRNKVIALKDDTEKIREGITKVKATGDISILDSILESVDSADNSLQSFILDKENKEEKSEEVETTEKPDNSDKSDNSNDDSDKNKEESTEQATA